jgi:hypothetical protein
MLKYYREMKGEGRDKILTLAGKLIGLDKLYNKVV